MSMNNYANHGYVVPATKLRTMLPVDKERKFLELVANNEPSPATSTSLEDLQLFFDENTTYAPHAEFFVLDDTSEAESLEVGKVYAQFDEADLFEMTPSKFMLALNKVGINPQNEQWVTWG
jgi:hypothetical protein